MPTYEYRRPDGSIFEMLQAFSDAPLKSDPETGVPVERILHAPTLHFKGKGFYNTDYGTRKRQRETASSADGSSSSSSDGSAAPGESSSSPASENDSSGSSAEQKADAGAAKSEQAPASSAS